MWRTTAAASLVLVSTVALADDKSDCLDSKDHELRIKSCSAMIERNPKDVVAYHNRGEAYELKGEVDRAISDYTKAIVSDPNFAPAYNGRGRTYVSKGDYVRAVDDVTRAGELSRKMQARPAVVEEAPPKQKKEASSGLPIPSKSPVTKNPSTAGKALFSEKSPTLGKAPVVEDPSTLGKSPVSEGSPTASKEPVVENPGESTWLGRWPTWMPR
jgi:hypothetical protein